VDDERALERILLDGLSLDSRRLTPGTLFVAARGEHVHGVDYLQDALASGAPAALVEGPLPRLPGREEVLLGVGDARHALAAMCRAYLERFSPVVAAITGSNGKTTTKDMTRAALRERLRVGANPGNLNSRWGLPQAVLGQSGDEELLILEMGASAPGEIAALCGMSHPRVGCITNVAPAHLEGFGDLRGVLDTKAALVESLPTDGLCVLNAEDPSTDELASRSQASRILYFGTSERSDFRIGLARQDADGLRVVVNGHEALLPIFGQANAFNVAAACAIASEWQVEVPEAMARMEDAPLSGHRSTLRRESGRLLLDDCYNANPRSMEAALESLATLPVEGERWAVLGSMRELGADSGRMHREILRRASELGIEHILPVGDEMKSAAKDCGLNGGKHGDERAEVARYLARESSEGDAILFKGSRGVALEGILDLLIVELHGRETD
jgi:UDP-N-acetylmuramoyl-tripeptide--D-alanyl-D-alanine ligase